MWHCVVAISSLRALPSTKLEVTFVLQSIAAGQPLPNYILLVTEACICEQKAWSHYMKVEWLEVECMTS